MIDRRGKRKNALEALNEAERGIESAADRLAKAKKAMADFEASIEKEKNKLRSEIGTAQKVLADAHGSYREARLRLVKLIPEEGGDEETQTEPQLAQL